MFGKATTLCGLSAKAIDSHRDVLVSSVSSQEERGVKFEKKT